MKRLFFMLVMLFTISVYSFAENNNTTEVERLAKYDLKIDNRRLAVYLDLNEDQMDAVEAVSTEFTNDIFP